MTDPTPEEIAGKLLSQLDSNWRSLKSLGLVNNTRLLIAPAHRLVAQGLVESRLNRNGSNLEYRTKRAHLNGEGERG